MGLFLDHVKKRKNTPDYLNIQKTQAQKKRQLALYPWLSPPKKKKPMEPQLVKRKKPLLGPRKFAMVWMMIVNRMISGMIGMKMDLRKGIEIERLFWTVT